VSAASLAEALQDLMIELRKNPVVIVDPASGLTKERKTPDDKDPPMPKDFKDPLKPEPRKNRPGGGVPVRTFQASAGGDDKPPPVEPQDKKKPAGDKPGREDAPIQMTAVGNRLIVTSTDQEALGLVAALVRQLTQTTPGEGDFKVLKLKHADATAVATEL